MPAASAAAMAPSAASSLTRPNRLPSGAVPMPSSGSGTTPAMSARGGCSSFMFDIDPALLYSQTCFPQTRRPPMKRLVYALDLKDDPALIADYEAWHRADKIWPSVVASLRASGIDELEIYRTGNRL